LVDFCYSVGDRGRVTSEPAGDNYVAMFVGCSAQMRTVHIANNQSPPVTW